MQVLPKYTCTASLPQPPSNIHAPQADSRWFCFYTTFFDPRFPLSDTDGQGGGGNELGNEGILGSSSHLHSEEQEIPPAPKRKSKVEALLTFLAV